MVVRLKLLVFIVLSLTVLCEAKRRKTPTSTLPTVIGTLSEADLSSGDDVKVTSAQPPVAAEQVMSTTLSPESGSTASEPPESELGKVRTLPIVYLEVLDAKIGTNYDWLSSTDCYVTVEVKNPGNETSYEVGKTRVAVDMINPEFYQVFKLDQLRTDSIITFKLLDNDYIVDEEISVVSIEMEKVLKTDKNFRKIKLMFNDNHDYVAIRIMIIAALIDYSEDRKRNEIAKDSLLITCCKWTEFKSRVQEMHAGKKAAKQTKEDFEYIVQFSLIFDDLLMRQICSEKYFHESFCSRLNSTETIPIYDQMLSTLLINL